MDAIDILSRVFVLYSEHCCHERNEPRYIVMNENTKNCLKDNIDMRDNVTGTRIESRIFGVKIAICEELADGKIEFVS